MTRHFAMLSRLTSFPLGVLGVLAGLLVFPAALCAHGDDQAMIRQIMEAISEELAKAPDADLFIRRGELHRHNQDWAKADVDFVAAAQLAPKRVAIAYLRARTFLDARQPEKAHPLANQYRARAPADPEAWFVHGEVLAALGETRLALADYAEGFRRAAEANADQVERWTRLLSALPQTDAGEILTIVDEALARLGPMPALVDYAIALEVTRQNYDGALARIEQARQKGRWAGTLLARRGDVLVQAGRRAEAVASYRAALEAIEKLSERNRTTALVQKVAREARDAIERLGTHE